MERRVYIAQVLCPQRHCIIACAEEYESAEAAEVLVTLVEGVYKRAVDAGVVDGWCGLCRSSVTHVELGRTKWTTMQEAQPYMAVMEHLNALSLERITRDREKAERN